MSNDKIAKQMLLSFIAERASVDNNSVNAEQNVGVNRYLDCVAFTSQLTKNADVVTKDGKAFYVLQACKAVNWSKSRLYQFLPIVDAFSMQEWIDVLGIMPVNTAVKLMQDSKMERNCPSYNRGDILRYTVKFYSNAPKYIEKLRGALACGLANEDADSFIKGFVGMDTVNEKIVTSALRAYHKPVVDPTYAEALQAETDSWKADTETDTSDIEKTVLEDSAKMRAEIDDLRKQLAIANGDIDKANKALYKAQHITVNGDTYLIDAKMRKAVIAPAIRKNAQDKGLTPLAIEDAKSAQAEKSEPVDRDKALLEQFAKSNERKTRARKAVQTKKTNKKNANKVVV